MNLYSEIDLRDARARVRKWGLWLGGALAVCLAAYACAVAARQEIAAYLILLAGLILALPLGMLRLYPAVRYLNFVRDLLQGLRREASGTIDFIDPAVQLQDGARVHALQLRLENGDTRVFYINASKLDACPEPGHAVRLKSFGRHIAGFEA